MNIWIVNHYAIPPSMGGLVRHYYFSKYLQKKGHTVRILTSSKIHNTDINMITDKALYKEKKIDGVEYTFVRSRNYKGNGIDRIINMIDFPFKVWRCMSKFAKLEKPDVIYTSSPDLLVAFSALLFSKKKRVASLVEVRDLWPESIVEYSGMSRKNLIIQVLYQLEKLIYVWADRLIFTFPGGKDYIRDKRWEKKIDLNKVGYINNGVDLEEFNINREMYKWKDPDLEEDNIFKIVYVGSVRLVNHLGDVIEAAALLKKRNIANIKILVFGDGTERAILEKKCKEENLPVSFKGRVEKKYIPYILSCANLNLINVKKNNLVRYGCSWNKLFDYIAAGKPILSNLPTNYDLIQTYNLGVSKCFTKEEYADEMIKFAQMPKEKYDQYAARFELIKGEFDYKNLTDKLEGILIEAVEENIG